MTEPSTRKCSRVGCNERYPLVLRAGLNSGKARAGRKQTYHQGRRYCSATCRKLASMARTGALQSSPERLQSSPKTGAKGHPATSPLSVTSVASPLVISMGYGGQKSGRAGPKMMPLDRRTTLGGFTVVPDPNWPNMYRVRRPDGSLTDMVNLTRARDAARAFCGTS